MKGAHIGVLDDILRLVAVAHDSTGNAVEPPVVTAHQDLEQLTLAREDAPHHLLVARALAGAIERSGLRRLIEEPDRHASPLASWPLKAVSLLQTSTLSPSQRICNL